jgi:homeobox protein cut-like
MKLYEKVRYMQSYRDEGSASWSSLAVPQASNDLGKYRTMYEDSLNPFQAFRGQVGLIYATRKLHELITI